VTIWFSLVYQN